MTDNTVFPDKLLNGALEGKSEDFKKRVWDYVGKSGLVPNDPLFLVLVATGRLEVLLEDAPDRLEQLFKNWNRELSRNLELVEGAEVLEIEVDGESGLIIIGGFEVLNRIKNLLSTNLWVDKNN